MGAGGGRIAASEEEEPFHKISFDPADVSIQKRARPVFASPNHRVSNYRMLRQTSTGLTLANRDATAPRAGIATKHRCDRESERWLMFLHTTLKTITITPFFISHACILQVEARARRGPGCGK